MMKTLIIGAHGKVGQLVVKRMKEEGKDFVAGLRNQKQIDAYNSDGISTQYIDLTSSLEDIKEAIKHSNVEAIVFSAGAGGAGYDLTIEIDLDGAIKTMVAAQELGIKRYIMVSAVYSDDSNKWDASGIRPYYTAKHYADKYLRGSGLDYTIIHPGLLTDESATGKIKMINNSEGGSVPRADVAEVIVQTIKNPLTIKKDFNFISGSNKITDEIR